MNILKLTFSLILVISAGAASGVRTYTPVPVKGSVVSVSRDSAFFISDPLTRAVYTYSLPHTDHRVTTFTDSCGRIRVTEERAYYPASGRTNMDSSFFNNEGFRFRYVVKSELNGSQEKYTEYIADDRDMVWRHDCEKLYYSNHFFGTKLDSHGNWTELHTDCGNNTMDPQPLVTREISYGLAADEEALLRHCNAVQQSIDSVKGGSATLGALLLMVGLALGIFVMCRRDMNFRLQSLLGGWIAGPVAIAGYYILQDNLKTLMGNTAVAVIGAVFILCMCWYFRVVIMRFEDNEKLSNSQVTVPFLLAKVMLVFFGWSVGAELFHTWWAALITMGVFALPIFAVPDRGERCSKCHKINTTHDVETIECGTRAVNHTEGDYIVTTTYQRVKRRRKCHSCGYTYLTTEENGEVLGRTRRLLPRPAAPAPKASASSSSDSKPEDRSWLGCGNQASWSGECLVHHQQCPFGSNLYNQKRCLDFQCK